MRYVFVLTPLVIFLIANYATSGISPATTQVALTTTAIANTPPPQTKLYGEKLGNGKFIPLKTVLQAPENYAGKQVMVTGYVRKACKKKGCWMEMGPSANKTEQGCRITFKDYGFFVPKDSAGASAKLAGTVEIKKLPKATVDHLESDGATFTNKAADGTAHEVRIVATGVELTTNVK